MKSKDYASYTIALASILYFSEGFPFGIANDTVNAYLSFRKIDLTTIGLIGSVGLIWTFKFFWAPLVDLMGTYRRWIGGALIVIAAAVAALGIVPPASAAFWAALLVLVVGSATQDIAVDGLVIRATPADLVGIVNSARVAAYRLAMLVAGGAALLLPERVGWRNTFLAAAAVPLLILAAVAFMRTAESDARTRHENPLGGLVDWLRRPDAFLFLAVILLYRWGDNALVAMVQPYWAARGFSPSDLGVAKMLSMASTILGAIAGGVFVTRQGIYRGLLVLGIVQMLSNLAYVVAAMTDGGLTALYGTAVLENFCGGLGTTAFLSFLMVICDKENAATEYAMLSALFAAGRTAAIASSGYLAKSLGFTTYFWVSVAFALPGLLLVTFLRARLARR